MTDQPTTEEQLAAARATNQRLNLRAQKLESELAAYRRAIDQWEVSERGTYVPLRTITAIAKAAGRDIEHPRWLLHYQRVEQAEEAAAGLAQALRLTREYVGADLLPAVKGWDWYDALLRWAPHELGEPDDGAPRPHVYLSTGCWHGDHAYCQSMTGLNGAKRPASCKKCGARCICPCHQQAGPLVHVGGGANAEDCPACAGTNPPYPFICPGPDAEQPARKTANNPATSSDEADLTGYLAPEPGIRCLSLTAEPAQCAPHEDGRECPCPPGCGCCKVTPTPDPENDRQAATLDAITAEAARRGVISIDGIRNIAGQQTGTPAAHQRLLAQLDADRAKMLRCAAAASEPEVRHAQEGIAAGLHTAAAWTIHLFEGDRARQAYLARTETMLTDGGPSIAEAAADDRKWALEKNGE